MAEDKNYEVLIERIENIRSEMAKGFEVVYSKQDRTNGRIESHDTKFKKVDDKLHCLEKKDITIENKIDRNKVMWFFITTLTTVTGFLLAYMFF